MPWRKAIAAPATDRRRSGEQEEQEDEIGEPVRRQAVQREVAGQLTALGADTVAGLRVLRGIGGEPAFLARYRLKSAELRRAGVHVASPQATLDSAQVLLPRRRRRRPSPRWPAGR